MKKTIFILVVILSLPIGEGWGGAAQNLDSLWGVWNDQAQPDTTRLKAIHEIAWNGYLFSQPDSAFYFAQMQYDFAKSKGLKKQMSGALNTQGASFYIRADYPKALDYFQTCLKIYEEIGNKKGIANAMNNIGAIYKDQGDYHKALEYYQRSLKIMEEIGDKTGIANALNNIGVIYEDQVEYPKALDYYQMSLKIREEIGDKNGIATSLNNVGIIYKEQGDYPKALDYYQRSLKIREEMGNKNGIAGSLNNIGNIYLNQGDYLKALDYCQRSLKMAEEIGDKKGMATTLNNIGKLYQKQEDHQKAINQCSKGLLLAQEIEAISLQREACKCLYDAYKSTGNGNKALEYHEQMLVLDDSLHAEETTKKLQQMEFAKAMLQDSIAKAEETRLVQDAHEEEMRAEEKTRNISFGVGALVLILAGGLYSRLRYIRKSKATLQVEKDRSDNLLLNILPEEIAQELKDKGKADARDFEMVSILFTDFKGFTEQSAKLSAAELVHEINHCFEAFDSIIEKYNIEKIKTIGDAYMAAGGLPVPTDDSVKNTVLAALEMQAFIVKRKNEFDAQISSPLGRLGGARFEMRVGIHTGPVVAGIVGVKKFQYDIWGDTVNTAARMESCGELGSVNISQATFELLKDYPDFTFKSRGKIEAKGKGVLEMYFVSRV